MFSNSLLFARISQWQHNIAERKWLKISFSSRWSYYCFAAHASSTSTTFHFWRIRFRFPIWINKCNIITATDRIDVCDKRYISMSECLCDYIIPILHECRRLSKTFICQKFQFNSPRPYFGFSFIAPSYHLEIKWIETKSNRWQKQANRESAETMLPHNSRIMCHRRHCRRRTSCGVQWTNHVFLSSTHLVVCCCCRILWCAIARIRSTQKPPKPEHPIPKIRK